MSLAAFVEALLWLMGLAAWVGLRKLARLSFRQVVFDFIVSQIVGLALAFGCILALWLLLPTGSPQEKGTFGSLNLSGFFALWMGTAWLFGAVLSVHWRIHRGDAAR